MRYSEYYAEFLSHPKTIAIFAIFVLCGLLYVLTSSTYIVWYLLFAGMFLFSLNEYLVHRFLLHEYPKIMPKSYEGHVAHHDYPTDSTYLFGPIKFDLLIYAVIYAGMLLITRNVHAAAALAWGFCFFHINYQWVHFVSHRPIVPIMPWNRWLKRVHLLHHFKDENLWFGVSDPTLDMVAGTYEKVKPKHTRYLRRQLKQLYDNLFHRS